MVFPKVVLWATQHPPVNDMRILLEDSQRTHSSQKEYSRKEVISGTDSRLAYSTCAPVTWSKNCVGGKQKLLPLLDFFYLLPRESFLEKYDSKPSYILSMYLHSVKVKFEKKASVTNKLYNYGRYLLQVEVHKRTFY